MFLEKKFAVRILDQRLDRRWRPKLAEVLREGVVCVGITCQTGRQIRFALEIAAAIREMSDAPIVWGGIHPTLVPEQTIHHPLVDYLVRGEGERAFPALVDSLAQRRSPRGIPGVWMKDGEGITGTPGAPFLDLESLPELPYELLDIHRYFPHGIDRDDFFIETSRGCPYACSYCYQTAVSRGVWRAQSPQTVIGRLERLADRFGAGCFHFVDDSFFAEPNRAIEIARAILKRGLKVHWKVQGANVNNIAEMSDEALGLLARSGCEKLHLGVESGSSGVLEGMAKPTTVEQVLRVNARLGNVGIQPWYYFSTGFPTETEDDLRRTINLIFRLLQENSDTRISPLYCMTPYPGTSLYQQALGLGFRPPASLEEWYRFNFDTINTPWITARRKHLLESLHFCSLFIDRKASDLVESRIIRFLAAVYRPLARWRVRRLSFRFMAERLAEKLFFLLSP